MHKIIKIEYDNLDELRLKLEKLLTDDMELVQVFSLRVQDYWDASIYSTNFEALVITKIKEEKA